MNEFIHSYNTCQCCSLCTIEMDKCAKVKRLSIFNKPLNLIVNILAFIGIVVQLYDQTSEFLSFPIYSTVEIRQTEDRLPAITFCIAVWYSEFESEFKKKTILEASKFAPDLNKSLIECKLTLPNGIVVDCLSITKVHKYMNSRMFCYSMFEVNRTFIPDEKLIYNQSDKSIVTPLISIKLESPYINSSHWALTVRRNDKPLTLVRSTESKNWIEPEVNEFIALNYKVIHRWQLPSPYPSNCHNYGEQYDSIKSLTDCWLEKFVSGSTHYWPEWSLYDYERNYSSEKQFRDIDPAKMHWPPPNVSSHDFPNVNEECFEKNQKSDCRRRYIVLSKIHSKKAKRNHTAAKRVTIQIPWVPATHMIVEQKAKLELIEFLSEVGGIFSMWIGFSMYMSLKEILFGLEFWPRENVLSISHSSPLFVSRRVRTAGHKWLRRTIESRSNRKTVTCEPKLGKIVKILDVVIKFACVFITSFFVYEIIFIYFETPFNTLLNSSIPKLIPLPQLTLCLNMTIEEEKMKRFYPEIAEKKRPEEWKSHLSIEQLFDVTLDWSEIFVPSATYMSPFDNSSERTKIDRDFNFTKSLTGRYLCFSTFSQKQFKGSGLIEPYKRAQVLHAMNFDVRINTSQLLKHKQHRIRAYVHAIDHIEEDFSAVERVTMDIDEREAVDINSYIIRVSTTVNTLYPDHIRSQCLNYIKVYNKTSQRHAIHDCVVDQFTKKYQKWPTGYRTSKRLNYTFSDRMEMAKELGDIENACIRKFQLPDCRTVYLKVALEDEFFKNASLGFTSLINYPPSKQFYEYKQQLVYSIIDILGFTGGTINAWIGLSFLDVQIAIIFIIKLTRPFYNPSRS